MAETEVAARTDLPEVASGVSSAARSSLAGASVLVTRSAEQNEELAERLERLGAQVVRMPSIRFEALDPAPLDAAVEQLGCYDWLLLTSANAVRFVVDRLEARAPGSVAHARALHVLRAAARAECGPRIAAIGAATAAALEDRGLRVDQVPEQFTAVALVESLGDLGGTRALLPRARIGRPEIARRLRAAGARVDDMAVYDTLPVDPDPSTVARLRGGVDVVTFTSPSAVRNTVNAISRALPDTWRSIMDSAYTVCIGPETGAEAEAFGLAVAAIPERYTLDGLVGAVAKYLARRKAQGTSGDAA